MKIIFALMLIPSLCFGQAVDAVDINDIESNGLFYQHGYDIPFTGVGVSYHKNGKKEYEGNYKDGKFEGTITTWYEDGQKRSVRNYRNFDPEGLWIVWDEHGRMREEVNYKDGQEIGRKEWDHDGNAIDISMREAILEAEIVKEEYVSRPDLEEREQGIFYEVGSDTPFTGVKESYRHDNGQKMKDENYKDGKKREGLWTIWYENGQKSSEENYKDGHQEGLWTWWYENGQRKIEGNYKDGSPEGLWTRWYENGQKSSEGKYGVPQGTWTMWYENGQKWKEENYKDGELISRKEWDENGKEIKN